MDLSQQFENHEQRSRLSTLSTLKAIMPGENILQAGAHIVGHLPGGSLVEGWSVWINDDEPFGGPVTLTLGTIDNPTMFADSLTVADGQSYTSAPGVSVLEFVDNEPLKATISLGGTAVTGVLNMAVTYTEVDTKVGKYAH